MIFLDANIFIRYLTGDDQEKAQACLALLQRVEGGEEATTSETIIAEVAYVLSSPRQYKLPHAEVSALLRPIILLRGLRLPDRRRLLRTLDLFRDHAHLDFEDCLTIAQVERQKIDALISYDRDFDRVSGITRVEPSQQPSGKPS